jgi:putative transposase
MIDDAVTELTPIVGRTPALSAVGVDRATWYRRHRTIPAPPRPDRVPTSQPRALSRSSEKR